MNDSRVETVYAVEEHKYISVSYGSSGWEEEVNQTYHLGYSLQERTLWL